MEFWLLGGLFHDPEGDAAFIETLKRNIDPKIEVVELDMHINDRAFGRQAVAILDSTIKAQRSP